MKQITLVLACILFYTGANAQQKKINQVSAACEVLRLAMVDPSAEKLNALLDDSLSYGHSGGHIDTKTEFIKKLTEGKSDFVSIIITNQTVMVRKNTAFVRHELTAQTNDNNKPGSVHLLVLLVWMKTHSIWKLVARQAVKPT